MRQDAVRVAALRMLMLTAATPESVPLSEADQRTASLVVAGYGVPDICAALGMSADDVLATLVRLAR